MAVSPITSVPLPAAGSTDQVPADLMTAFTAAEKMFVGQFASASARDAKITAPVGGMTCWLATPGCYSEYLGSGWKNRYSTGVSFQTTGWPSTTMAGANGITTATLTITPNVGPYLLRVTLGALITAGGSTIPTMQMFLNGTIRAQYRYASISPTNQLLSSNMARDFYISDGSTSTVYGRVDIPGGTTVTTYADDTHAFLTVSVQPV